MKRIALASMTLFNAACLPGPVGALAVFASPMFAQAAESWNGTWAGGWKGGAGAQIVFAGDDVIALYWRGDYIEDAHGALTRGGAGVTIAWTGGQAVLTREGPGSARIVIRQQGQPDASFTLKKD
jgi:hypothetical protein